MIPGAATKGSRMVANALKGVEVERIIGPGNDAFVQMGSMWAEQPVVIHLFRRFGCRICRGVALEMSKAIPALQRNGIRVVGIGPDALGVDEFVDQGFWAGELYVDDGRRSYGALQLKPLSTWQALSQLLFNSAVKEAMRKTQSVPGNFKGDGMVMGGTFLLQQGGAMITELRQATPADHFTPEQLLEAFGIDPRDNLPADTVHEAIQSANVAGSIAAGNGLAGVSKGAAAAGLQQGAVCSAEKDCGKV